jgi:ribosomal protein L11 methyltransferase
MNRDYFVLSMRNVSDRAEEWLSETAFRYSALGISEILEFDQPEGEEQVYTRIPDRRALNIYFATLPAPDFLHEVRARFPEIQMQIKGEDAKDWLAEWKKGFQPFALTEGHWVVPSWCEPPAEAIHKIWMDPGMAFGTGTHETTQLVAEELGRLAQETNFGSCLDVGTGTGILAILAKQLKIAEVYATEIEADSRRVALENFEKNEADDIVMSDAQVEDIKKEFDVVIANIIDGVLVRIQHALKTRVKAGGWLLLSGIIGEREKDFLEGFELPPGKSWDVRRQKGDWLLYGVKL